MNIQHHIEQSKIDYDKAVNITVSKKTLAIEVLICLGVGCVLAISAMVAIGIHGVVL